MKIRKSFVSVFIITFFIGYASVLPTQKIEPLMETPKIQPVIQPVSSTEKPPELERIEVNDNWIDEERYPLKIKLLETGDGFHGSEVSAGNGEIWLGLFEESGKFYLRSTKLKIKRVVDGIVDDKPGQKTGKSVAVGDQTEPLFLLKNARKLKHGEVKSLFKGVSWSDYLRDYENSDISSDEVLTNLKENFTQNYEIGGKTYRLKVIKAVNNEGESILALVLEGEGTRQILHTINAGYSSDVGTLDWVGDLDRDNKPDFFLQLYVHDNVNNQVLFLSSEAEKGKLVRKVAYFWTTGC